MAGLEALAGLGGGIGTSAIADAWRQQMLSGADAASGVAGTSGIDDLAGAAGVTGTDPASGLDFGAVLGRSLQSLEATDAVAQSKAVAAATGDLNDVHDYVIAANQVQVATELTTTIRNKALEAFTDIMRMPL